MRTCCACGARNKGLELHTSKMIQTKTSSRTEHPFKRRLSNQLLRY
ncbi:hypothetical protein J2Z18_001747 [Paenibacillus lactis]|uniref:Uncharacterized protein n=1 Tax=Paenibacillus lactis TaxID=228574 RepID=A0ABS4F8Q4_9BACL|nr:hypothetical protein [Paenibacillus lactis]